MKKLLTTTFLFCAMQLSAQMITATGDTLTPRCCVTSLELVRDETKAEAYKAHKAYMKRHRAMQRWVRKTIIQHSK